MRKQIRKITYTIIWVVLVENVPDSDLNIYNTKHAAIQMWPDKESQAT